MRTDSAFELPPQDVHSRQEKTEQVRQQQGMLEALRAQAASSDDAGLTATADALQRQYHAADHSRLHADVYLSAAHQPASPGLGYFRASENPAMARGLGIDWTDQQLGEFLQPDDSDFRAEIYLPDPSIHGPNAKPVLVFKGSNGPVVAQDDAGRTYTRGSELSDWIENGRQAQGMESDHYNRAMDLGTAFKVEYDQPFEIGGHSKGGGQALAAAAVTGMAAFTFNAATLHPETARRYTQQNVLQLHDVDTLAHGYYVKGEVLHDGLNLLQGMGAGHQAQLAGVIGQVSELAQLPEARQRLGLFLQQSLPYDPGMREAAIGLVDELSARATGQTLRALPLHAGPERLVELAPKGRDTNGELVDRPLRPSLHAASVANIPLLNAMSVTTALGVAGKRAGQTVATGGQVVEHGASVLADASRTSWQISGRVGNTGSQQAGEILGATVRYQGQVIANARLAGGHAEAFAERTLGGAQQWSNGVTTALLRKAGELPFLDGLRDAANRQDQASHGYVERRHAAADQAIGAARQDAGRIGTVADRTAGVVQRNGSAVGEQLQAHAGRIGDSTADGFRSAGASVRIATDRAPALGAAYGVSMGIGTQVPSAVPLVLGAGVGKLSADEALTRHGMREVVQPSMDARTRTLEHAALQRLEQLRARDAALPERSPSDAKATLLLDDPRHSAFPLYRSAERGVHGEDARVGRQPDVYSRQIAGSLAAEMHGAGGSRVDHVAVSGDARTIFAVQGRLDDPGHLRISVDTVAAMNTPLAESSQRVAAIDTQRGQAVALEQQQEQARTHARGMS